MGTDTIYQDLSVLSPDLVDVGLMHVLTASSAGALTHH